MEGGAQGYLIKVSIPQAVGTIAIQVKADMERDKWLSFNTASGRYYCNCQDNEWFEYMMTLSFNTASGRYYCNFLMVYTLSEKLMKNSMVSIPQAVGTIAICRNYGVPADVNA